MKQNHHTAIYVFLAFAAVAVGGLVHTMISGQPVGMAYRGLPMQDYPLDPEQFPVEATGPGGGYVPPEDQPGLIRLPMLDCQSQCFGTEPGRPRVGQQPLGGAALRQCLANCQMGISPEQQMQQECYTCSCPSEGITADNLAQAQQVCTNVCGSDGKITSVLPRPCKY